MNELPVDDLAKLTLTDRLAQRLGDQIRSGALKPGQQLPTGQELARHFGVSLIVVREALSSLRSEGLIQTRQGSGAFVSPTTMARPFRLMHAPSAAPGPQKLFELRTGVEVQAAFLAAQRATDTQLQAIAEAYRAMETDIAAGHDSVGSDVLFHRRIAEASGNELFASFLDFLSEHIRGTIQASREGDAWSTHRNEVMAEHRAMMEALLRRDAEGAKAAAQAHMDHCLHRCLPAAEAASTAPPERPLSRS